MTPWYEPMRSQFFVSGVVILACLAFFLMWAVRNHGPQVYLCILIAMFGVGSLQAVYGKSHLYAMRQAVRQAVLILYSPHLPLQ